MKFGHKLKCTKRLLSLALSIVMVLSLLPAASFAAESDGLCEHHPKHTADCGYAAAVEGKDCTHVCGDECYTVATDCGHTHDAGCYSDGELQAEGEEKTADACTHVCTEESGCVTKTYSCVHTAHDDSCGYVEAVAGRPCGFVCKVCAGEPEKEPDGDTVVTDWEWVDDWDAIDPDSGKVLLPFASAENVVRLDDVLGLLPVSILADGEELTLGQWTCDAYPQEGAYEGEYVFETTLPQGYVLEDGGNVLHLTVVLGDPEGEPVGMMTITPKEPEKDTNGNYKISSAAELYWFANEVNENRQFNINAVLMNDITVNTGVLDANGNLNSGNFEPWTPIGVDINRGYSGTFDGQGHTISGLYLNDVSDWYVGLFGASAGTITNVKIADSYFNAMKCVGGVCGINGGTVRNCVNSGTVIAYSDVGGVCGTNITRDSYHGTITDCYNTGKVTGTYEDASVGGVCGSNTAESDGTEQSLVTGCYNTGAVSGTKKGARVGGVCGYNGSSTIKDCYNTGAVSGTGSNANVGGVCGYSNFTSATITGCYSTGSVSGTTTYTGGVCGCNNTGSAVNNCYYNTDTYNGEPVGCNAVGTISGTVGSDVLGKTTREFASGQVAYLLNGNSSSGIWKQNIDVGTPDAAPNFTGGTVYTTASNSACKGYSNTDSCTRDHNYEGGICLWCGEDTNLYITVSGIEAKDKTYDGTTTATLKFDNVQLAGKAEGDAVSVTATGTFDRKDAGSRTVNITGLTLTGKDASKYRLADSGQQTTTTASITPKDITVTITPGGGTYGGTITPATASLEGVLPGEIVPAVTLYYSGYANDGVLHSGERYPTKAGTYTVEAVNIRSGNYTLTGTTTAQFVINRATVTTPTVASKVYTGSNLTADISNTDRYTVTTNDGGTDVGSYNLVLTLTDAYNYQWDENGGTPTFQITKAANQWTVTPTITGWTYGDTPSTPTGAASFGAMKVEYTSDGTTYRETVPTNAGAYKALFTVAATDNYAGLSEEKDFTISPKSVTVSGITAEDKTYDGNTNAELVCTNADFDGKVEGDTLTVTATGTFENENAGENKTVAITGLTLGGASKDNYKLAAEGQQKTTTASILVRSIDKPQENTTAFTYTGSEQTYTLTESVWYSITGNTRTDAGSQTVTVALKDTQNTRWADGTTDDVTFPFAIGKADSSVTTAPADARSLYTGGNVPLIKAGIAEGGTMQYRLGADGQWSDAVPQAVEYGEYTVYYHVKGDGNHEDTAEQSVKARIRPFRISLQPQPQDINYGNSAELSVSLETKVTEGISYQWCLVTVEETGEVYTPLENGTGSTLTLTKPNAGTYVYACIITYGDYSETSGRATVTVTAVRETLPPTSDLPEGLWVEGGEKPLVGDSIDLKSPSSFLLTSYTYNGASDDVHQNYPTGMQVYSVGTDEQGVITVTPVADLGNLLQYSGCSIRITGKPGIRMITSLTKEAKEALKKGELADYTLEEYGTVVAWKDTLGDNPLTLSTGESNYAYRKGVSDPVFANVGALTQYTNVLVWDELEDAKYAEDIVMRPYIILSKDGETVTLYGAAVSRSIGYIAYQNRSAFAPGTAAYGYVWDMIHAAYGTQYDSEYQG